MAIKISELKSRALFNCLSLGLFALSLILICCGSLGFVGMGLMPAESSVADGDFREIQQRPGYDYDLKASSLLLGSQLVQSQTAKIRYTLWMEENNSSQEINNNQEIIVALSNLDNSLQWQQESLSNGWGQKAVCFWAEETVDVESEKLAPAKLKQFEQTVYLLSGQPNTLSVYLEESVDEIINLQDYWYKENISLYQSSNDGVVESWSGSAPVGLKPRMSGEKAINVQLTTRKIEEGGKTVLALPALYNDI